MAPERDFDSKVVNYELKTTNFLPHTHTQKAANILIKKLCCKVVLILISNVTKNSKSELKQKINR